MKKTICLILTLITVFAVIPLGSYGEENIGGNRFEDVPEGKWYTEHISFVDENGLMTGTGDKTFSPDVKLTRAMTAQIIYRIAANGYKADVVFFEDVPLGKWYSYAANWTHGIGAYFDSDHAHFQPDKPVTRTQFCEFVRCAFYARADLQSVRSLSDFDSVSSTDASQNAFSTVFAYITGLISGKPSKSGGIDLAGDDFISRAEAAVIIHSLVNNLSLPEKKLSIDKYGATVKISPVYNGFLYVVEPGSRPEYRNRSTLTVGLVTEDAAALENEDIRASGTIITPYGNSYRRVNFGSGRKGNSFSAGLTTDIFEGCGEAIISVNVTINGETFSFTDYVIVTQLA